MSSTCTPPKPGAAEERLDRDHVARAQLAAGAAQPRILVDLEPDAVAERDREALHELGAGAALGREALGLEAVARERPQVAPEHAGADGGDRLGLDRAHERLPCGDLRVRLADGERARDVGEAGGCAVLRPEVDDHRLAGRDRPPVSARGLATA
jgi:hypothetical protein